MRPTLDAHTIFVLTAQPAKIGATMPRTKRITLDIRTKSGARKLAGLVADGWVIISEHKRGLFEWKPGQIDYVLAKK